MPSRPPFFAGLTGSQTNDDAALALRSDYPLSSTAIWTRGTGTLELTVEPSSIFVAGHDYTFNFTVINQARAQCAVSPSIQTCLDAKEQMVTDGTTLLNKKEAQAGDARPFTILRSYFVTKNIGQTVPYPGCSNTIIVTVSFNLPAFPAHCDSFIRISGLKESSSYPYMLPPLDGALQLSGEMHRSAQSWSPGFCDSNETIDSLFFRNHPAGTSGFADWENAKSGSNPQCRRLTAYFAKVTNPGEEYVFQFQVTNPVGKTISPSIYLEGKMQDKNQDQNTFQFFDDAPPSRTSTATSPHCTAYSCNTAQSDTCLETGGCKHAMNKDSSTVLCCSQCSFAGQAVAAASTGRSSGAIDGQMTTQGDAEPFKVHTPFFCVKKIGQSSCYPCDSNTLTVTLTSNAGMKAGGTKVTITNLNNANWRAGNITLLDGPNKLGSHMSFSSSFTGARGEALWEGNSLTLFVVRDIDCTAEIQLSFVLENPSCEQDAQPVSIQASDVGNVPGVVASGVDIAKAAMDHDNTVRGSNHWGSLDVRGFAEGDAAPLKVCKLEIQSATVADTSDHPCDSNQIQITDFRTNVPIQKTDYCSPSITVSGLTNAIFAPGVLNLDNLDDVTGVTEIGNEVAASVGSAVRSQGTWTNTCNQKRATFAVRATINSHVGKAGGSTHMFGFTVKNPAKAQTAVAVSLTVRGCGDAKTTGTTCTAAVRSMGSIMEVLEAEMETRLQQSSSFPCDDNTITVDLKSNVKVLSACEWKCTITGFQDLTATDGAITLAQATLVETGVTNDAHQRFTGDWSTGSPTWTRKLVVTLGSSTQVDDANAYESTWHRMQFAATNHQSSRASCSLQAQCTLTFANVEGVGTACTGSQQQSTVQSSSVVVTSTAALEIAGKSVAAAGTDADDFKVCYVRTPTWSTSTFTQDDDTPCYDNTIAVSLTANVPIFYSKGACTPRFTLTGLTETGSCTEDLWPQFKLHGSDGGELTAVSLSPDFTTATDGQWIGGTVALTPSSSDGSADVFMLAGEQYSVRFTLINPTAQQSKTVSVDKVGAPVISATQLTGLFAVVQATVKIVGFEQTSRYPCDANIITVSLQSSHTLLTRCNPTITLAGFANTDVSQGLDFFADAANGWKTLNAAGDASLATEFSSWMAGNSVASGLNDKIVFRVGATATAQGTGFLSSMVAATGAAASMVVKFQVLNKKDQLNDATTPPSQALTVSGRMESSCTGDSMIFDTHTYAGVRYEVDCIQLAMAVTQSSSAPCNPENTITIALTASSALRCPGEKITIQGLGCRETADGALFLTSTNNPATVMDTAEFSKEGKIVVTLADPGLAGSAPNSARTEAANPDVSTFSFTVANPPQSCGASTVSVTLGSGASVCTTNGVTITSGELAVDDFSFKAADTNIVQSSSTPCAENAIFVTFQTSHPLHMHCASEITLSGLSNTQVPSPSLRPRPPSLPFFPLFHFMWPA